MAKSPKTSQPQPPVETPQNTGGTIEMVLNKSSLPKTEGSVPKPATETIRVASPQRTVSRPAIPYRPMARPKVAMLTVCDDGRTDGEVIRIRGHRFVIGRTEGDLCIPVDGRISARHVEITLQTIGGAHYRWVVTDLQSTHGLFVRVSRARLAEQSEFLVGCGRYRFDAPQYAARPTTEHFASDPAFSQTHGWADATGNFRPPALTELLGDEIGNRAMLTKPEYWIGTDPDCASLLAS